MLLSTYRRAGEPVIVACGPSRIEEGLQVGLLAVAAGLTQQVITLAGGEHRVTVSIPNEYLNLPEPKWVPGATLEVTSE